MYHASVQKHLWAIEASSSTVHDSRLGTKQPTSKPVPVSSLGHYLLHTLALLTYATSKAPVLMPAYAKITTFVRHRQLSFSSLSQFVTHFACCLPENHLRIQQQLTHEISSWLNPVNDSDWCHIAQWTSKLLWNLSRRKGVFFLPSSQSAAYVFQQIN